LLLERLYEKEKRIETKIKRRTTSGVKIMTQSPRKELVEKMAEVIHDNCFVDEYKDLHIKSIERALAIQQANAVLSIVIDAIEDIAEPVLISDDECSCGCGIKLELKPAFRKDAK